MSKEELEKIPNHIENNLNKTEPTKNLCVHDLKKKLRVKQKRQFIINAIILSIIVVFFGVMSLLIYQSL